jgi:hypothetical protein
VISLAFCDPRRDDKQATLTAARSLAVPTLIPPSMPTISPRRDIQRSFAEARQLSAGSGGKRWVVIIAPDGALIRVPVPPAQEADPTLLRDVRRALAPENEPITGLAITSINHTTGVQRRARSFHRLLPLLPNLSYLVGAACLGNSVVAFEGHPRDFTAGCVEADLLLLDDGMVPLLAPDWAAVAVKALRQPRIVLFGRDGRLAKLTRIVAVDEP